MIAGPTRFSAKEEAIRESLSLAENVRRIDATNGDLRQRIAANEQTLAKLRSQLVEAATKEAAAIAAWLAEERDKAEARAEEIAALVRAGIR